VSMSAVRAAFLFPGQGAYYAGALQGIAAIYPEVSQLLEQMDEPSGRLLGISVSSAVLHSRPRGVDQWLDESPEALQLAMVGVSVAAYQALRAEGITPDVLVGHSLGEIAALVAAGTLTIAEASEIVCHRSLSLRDARLPAGYLLALGTDAVRARHLLDVVGDETAGVAAVNGRSQTVLSGCASTMDAVAELASVLKVSATRLKSPYPFHSPLLSAASHDFHNRIRHIRPRPATVEVYSPITGRAYEAGDDIAGLIASHFVRTVNFRDAVQYLRNTATGIFVECGALDSLTRLARRAAEGARALTIAPLSGGADEVASWRQAVGQLTDLLAAQGRDPSPAPAASPAGAPTSPASTGSVTPQIRRNDVLADLVTLYAEALEYPPEVFAEDTDLEAELGVDSVKQTELLGRVSEIHGLAPRPADFRLADYGTLGRVANLVVSAEPSSEGPKGNDEEPAGRADVLAGLVTLYAEALEYPAEVFAEDTDLEAELGVDSVKQTELLGRVSEIHGLAPRPADFRLADYGTLGRITDLVQQSAPALANR